MGPHLVFGFVDLSCIMKVLVIVFIAFIGLLEAHTLQKRGISNCKTNNDCPQNHCCVNFGLFRRCNEYVSEGSLCAIRNALSCGCAPGLECVETSFITKRCKDTTPGSGDY